MKTLIYLCVMGLALPVISCSEGNESTASDPAASLEPFSKVSIDGNVRVEFYSLADSPQQGHTVTIVGTPEQRSLITLTSTSGVLQINAPDLAPGNSAAVRIYSGDLQEIALQQGRVAQLQGIEDDALNVVAKSGSSLEMLQSRVDGLTADIEPGANFLIATAKETSSETQTIPEAQGTLLTNLMLLVNSNELVVGDNITLSDGNWIVHGATISRFYIMDDMNISTEGSVTIDAGNAPVKNLSINFGNQSEASVWAFDRIMGTATGNAQLHYRWMPALDLDGLNLQGTAQATPIP